MHEARRFGSGAVQYIDCTEPQALEFKFVDEDGNHVLIGSERDGEVVLNREGAEAWVRMAFASARD